MFSWAHQLVRPAGAPRAHPRLLPRACLPRAPRAPRAPAARSPARSVPHAPHARPARSAPAQRPSVPSSLALKSHYNFFSILSYYLQYNFNIAIQNFFFFHNTNWAVAQKRFCTKIYFILFYFFIYFQKLENS